MWRKAGLEGNYRTGDYRQSVHLTSTLEVDHRLPLKDGGDNQDANLWLLCHDCHRSKTTGEHSARLKQLFAEVRI